MSDSSSGIFHRRRLKYARQSQPSSFRPKGASRRKSAVLKVANGTLERIAVDAIMQSACDPLRLLRLPPGEVHDLAVEDGEGCIFLCFRERTIAEYRPCDGVGGYGFPVHQPSFDFQCTWRVHGHQGHQIIPIKEDHHSHQYRFAWRSVSTSVLKSSPSRTVNPPLP